LNKIKYENGSFEFVRSKTMRLLVNRFIVVLLVALVLAIPLFVAAPVVAALDDFWITKAAMPEAVVGHGVAAVDGKIYVIGGSNYAVWVVNSTFQYDPVANSWVTKSSMPTPRSNFGIAVYAGKIFCIGGDVGADQPLPTNITEVYDPATDSWETRTSMPTARYDLTANVVNGKIYLIGGFDYIGPYCLNITEVYDPTTDTWTTKASMPTGVMSYASAVINDKIYVLAGRVYSDTSGYDCNLTQIYDPTANTWTFGAELPEPVTYAAAAATTGVMASKRIYVLGGRQVLDTVNLTQIYDSDANSWVLGTPMPTTRCRFGAAVVDDRIYAIGGLTGWFASLTTVNELYTPIGYRSSSEFQFWIILALLIVVLIVVYVVLRCNHT
jgi:N-acetylneuraminic acid mutarotase